MWLRLATVLHAVACPIRRLICRRPSRRCPPPSPSPPINLTQLSHMLKTNYLWPKQKVRAPPGPHSEPQDDLIREATGQLCNWAAVWGLRRHIYRAIRGERSPGLGLEYIIICIAARLLHCHNYRLGFASTCRKFVDPSALITLPVRVGTAACPLRLVLCD